MSRAITIDDFPIETSIQWAKSQQDLKPIEDAQQAISTLYQTEITVATPTYDHLTLLFEQNKRAPTWASFTPPSHFYTQSNRFFDQTLISDINPSELMEVLQTHIDSLYALNISLSPVSAEKVMSVLETLESLNQLLADMRTRILRHRKA